MCGRVARVAADGGLTAGLRCGHRPRASAARALDAIWLHALARDEVDLEPAFVALCAGVPVATVLRFLDGGAGVRDLTRVVRALPPGPFVKSAARLAVGF